MSNLAKILLMLLVLAGVVVGLRLMLVQDSTRPRQNADATAPEQPPVREPEVPPAATATPAATDQQPIRTEAKGPAGGSSADAAQGVRGRIVLPDGTPAAGVQVLLLESAMSNPIEIFVRNKMGQVSPPIAVGTTDADGSFALGVRQVGKAVDLRVVSDRHPELQRPQIKLREADWYDAGTLQLETGILVIGRIVDSRTKAGIPDASVYMINSSQSHSMVATPGRERGQLAISDRGGSFEFRTAPRNGIVNFTAEAPGYAAGQVLNRHLRDDTPNEITIELEGGAPITGIVVDQEGQPIAGARITANGLSSKTPQSEVTTSAADGMFVFPNLRTGPYQLAATSPQYGDAKVGLAVTGDDPVKIVMRSRGIIKLRVVDAKQRPVKAYRVGLKRFFPGNPMGIGNVLDFPDRNISPADYPAEFRGEWAVIRGVPTGHFRLQITERNHAKTLSPDFTVNEGEGPVEVIAVLTLGATITGKAVDERGQPVANALVTTDMNMGLAADSGLFEIFGKMIPEKHTVAQTRTDDSGKFTLSRLSFAHYMVRVAHPEFCEGTAIDIQLDFEGQVVDVGTVELRQGAVVEGLTTVEGAATGQIKVQVSLPLPGPGAAPREMGKPAGSTGQAMFNANVLSQGDGTFRLLKRVPPGRYKATASRPSQDPFGTLMDLKQSEQEFDVAPGQDRIVLRFDLPRR